MKKCAHTRNLLSWRTGYEGISKSSCWVGNKIYICLVAGPYCPFKVVHFWHRNCVHGIQQLFMNIRNILEMTLFSETRNRKGSYQMTGVGDHTDDFSCQTCCIDSVHQHSVMVNQLVLVLPSFCYQQSWLLDVPNLPAVLLVNHLASVCPYSQKRPTFSWCLADLPRFLWTRNSVLPLRGLQFGFWVVTVDPGFVSCYGSWKEVFVISNVIQQFLAHHHILPLVPSNWAKNLQKSTCSSPPLEFTMACSLSETQRVPAISEKVHHQSFLLIF